MNCRILFVLVFFTATTFGQTVTGLAPFTSQSSDSFGSVNLGSLNVHFEIPVINKPGRGLAFNYSLTYDSSIWVRSSSGSSAVWQPTTIWYGWSATKSPVGGYVKYKTLTLKCYPPDDPWYLYTRYTYYAYVDRSGVSHPFNLVLQDDCTQYPRGGEETTSDGSGLKLTMSAGGSAATIQDPNGNTYSAPVVKASQIPDTAKSDSKDDNGNKISTTDGANFTDTLGHPVLSISGTNPLIHAFETPNGDTSNVKVNYATFTLKTNFGCSGITEYGPTTISLPVSIDFPDDTHYTITYEHTPGYPQYYTGRIATITLPTDGQVSYDYTGPNNGIVCADGSTSKLTRTENPGGTWTYSRSLVSGTKWLTTVTDPLQNQSAINFQQATLSDGSSTYLETKRVSKSGSATVLQTVETCYNGANPDCTATTITYPLSSRTVTTRLPDTSGRTSQVYTAFDNSPSRGLPSEIREYDFGAIGSGLPGSLLRKTTTSYAALGNGIRSKPFLVQVYDGNNNLKAQIQYAYDDGSLMSTSAPQHDSVSGSRGNPTTISRWVSDGTWLSKTYTYYDTGLIRTAKDSPTTPETTYSYDECGNAFPTYVALPLNLHRSAHWNCYGGVMEWSKDENDQQTSYTYDNMWRLTAETRPDGGVTTIDPDPTTNSITRTDSIDDTTSLVTKSLYDGFGRTTETQITSDPDGTVYQTIIYDTLGRLWKVSNPYRTTSDDTYGTTEYLYDALGRRKQITRPDNNTVLYNYWGGATSFQDEGNGTNRVQRIYQTDGLGRLKSVCEVTSTALIGISPNPAPCQLDVSGSTNGFLTTYQYDALDNLTQVVQGGLNNRNLSYDGLSRLTSETVPETANAAVTLNYDSKGNLYQRIRPRVNQSNPAVKTTTTYSYDDLHRLTQVQYDDGTPAANYFYDESTAYTKELQNPKGRLTHTSRTVGNVCSANILSYDPLGRVLEEWQGTAPACEAGKNVSYRYDEVGNVKSLTNGKGVTFTQAYDTSSRFTSMTSSWSDAAHPGTLISDVHYNALGQVTSGTLGNGISLGRTYNVRGFLTSAADGTIWSATDITYKPNGNIAFANDNVNGNWSYTYDDFNRIKTATKTGQSFSYDYDRYGNRWHQNGGPGPQPQYTFDANNRIEPTNGITYDAAGNVINDGSHTYTYDAENRLVGVDGGDTASYVYDVHSRRVRVAKPAGTQDYLFDLNGKTVAVLDASDGGGVRYEIWSPVGYLATYVNSTTYFNHADWLGTVRARSDASGGLAEPYTSLAFGDDLSGIGLSPVHLTGQERDSEDNLDHFWFRQYSSTQGRWMSPDPAGMAAVDPTGPQSWNRYTYVQNNPSNLVDPFGLRYWWKGSCLYESIDRYWEQKYLGTDTFLIGCASGPRDRDDGHPGPQPTDPANKDKCPSRLMQSINMAILSSPQTAPQLAMALAIARNTGLTVGFGGGGSVGVGLKQLKNFGYGFSASAQVVVDPHGNVGLSISYGGGGGWGSGVVAGGQYMLSRAGSIWALDGPSASFTFGGGRMYGGAVDVSSNGGGALTVTGGFAWGGFGVAGGGGPTTVITLACQVE